MAKRFTDTEIWDKEWFMELPAVKKCLVRYVFDKCDVAGIWSPNWKLASIYIGEPVTEADLLLIGKDLFIKMESGKIFVAKFCAFQYGTLSENCAPHKKVIQILNSNSIDHTYPEGYSKGILTLQEKEKDIDMDMEKEEEQDKEIEKGSPRKFESEVAEVIAELNTLASRSFNPSSKVCYSHISARLKEGHSVEDLKKVVQLKVYAWRNDPKMKEFIRPQTLFNSENFDGYLTDVKDHIRNGTKPNTTHNIPKTAKEIYEAGIEAMNRKKSVFQ